MTPSGMAIDQKIYLEQCISKRLFPFIQKHYSKEKYVFWPDLASSHYAESVMDYYIENSINFVEKYENPANCPELRPIEDFWSILKGAVYKGGWVAKDIGQLKRKIKQCVEKLDLTSIRDLFDSTHRRLDYVRRHGLRESQ